MIIQWSLLNYILVIKSNQRTSGTMVISLLYASSLRCPATCTDSFVYFVNMLVQSCICVQASLYLFLILFFPLLSLNVSLNLSLLFHVILSFLSDMHHFLCQPFFCVKTLLYFSTHLQQYNKYLPIHLLSYIKESSQVSHPFLLNSTVLYSPHCTVLH